MLNIKQILEKQSYFMFFVLIVGVTTYSICAQDSRSRSGADPRTESRTSKVAERGVRAGIDSKSQFTASFTEGFDGGAVPAGWSVQNLSTTIGGNTNCWNIFDATVWPPQAGAGHIGANFNCTTAANTISGWLFSPNITFNNGDQVKFWTRTTEGSCCADRLELRLSTNGTSVNAGTTSSSVGDFTLLLTSVNSTLTVGGYPEAWTQFSATISGLAGPTSGRVAFRYYVTNGGPTGANSNIMSIDTFDYVNSPTAANVTVSGRVTTSEGRGLKNALVTISNNHGVSRNVMTGPTGSYLFGEVEAGETYIISVQSRRFEFAPRVLSVNDSLSDVDFIAQ